MQYTVTNAWVSGNLIKSFEKRTVQRTVHSLAYELAAKCLRDFQDISWKMQIYAHFMHENEENSIKLHAYQ